MVDYSDTLQVIQWSCVDLPSLVSSILFLSSHYILCLLLSCRILHCVAFYYIVLHRLILFYFVLSNSLCSCSVLFCSVFPLTFRGPSVLPPFLPLPLDSKRPRGKLRLLNEVSPLSFLVEQVGPYMLYCTVLYDTVCTILCVLFCVVLYCTILCTVLYCTVRCCTVLNDTTLYCSKRLIALRSQLSFTSVCLCVCPSIICLVACLSVSAYICLSIHLYFCLFISVMITTTSLLTGGG
jgi:hypothetical protein